MMTDEELDSFEDACKDALAGMYGYSSKQYLELIAMIRQARAERDWLAQQLEDGCACHSDGDADYCLSHSCDNCKYTKAAAWLEAAKEAVCQKN